MYARKRPSTDHFPGATLTTKTYYHRLYYYYYYYTCVMRVRKCRPCGL